MSTTTDADADVADTGTVADPAADDDPATDPAVEETVAAAGESRGSDVATIRSQTDRVTGRWKGVSALALVTGAVGIVTREPELLLAAVVGVAYVAYARAGSAPGVSLAVQRSFSDTDPDPGEEVTVTVTVTNRGDRLPDLRVVDGVPDSLPVVDGSPRLGTALRQGQSDTFEYTVRAKRGTHEFDSIQVIARGFTGSEERELDLVTDDRMVCTPSTDPTREVPLRQLTSRITGRVSTNDGGEGVEFYATREYRPGDSLSRIDWNRHARTGKLATLEFRQERAATAVLILDLRAQSYVREGDTGLHAADRGVDAASQVFAALLETGDRVGIGAFSHEEVWLPPSSGSEHQARARELFATHPSLSPEIPDQRVSVTVSVRQLRRRLPSDAQVILFSPLVDDDVARGARLLDAHGHLVTIVSPDPTAEGSPGQRLAGAERTARMTDLRGKGIRVIDWAPDEELATAIDRASRRWSA